MAIIAMARTNQGLPNQIKARNRGKPMTVVRTLCRSMCLSQGLLLAINGKDIIKLVIFDGSPEDGVTPTVNISYLAWDACLSKSIRRSGNYERLDFHYFLFFVLPYLIDLIYEAID